MKVKFDLGAEADMLSPAEHKQHLGDAFTAFTAERWRGVKHMRLPELQGTAAAGVLSIGSTVPRSGPREGFCWSIRRLVVGGLTTGATPDIVNFYFNHTAGGAAVPVWQLNGNQFGQTFGRLELTMYGGDILIAASLGSFAATGQITVTGELIECPAEMITKLA
jgi:hypothetical protein